MASSTPVRAVGGIGTARQDSILALEHVALKTLTFTLSPSSKVRSGSFSESATVVQ